MKQTPSSLRCLIPLLLLAGCATHPPAPPVATTMDEPPRAPAPKSVLLEASKPHFNKRQFSAEIALTNETSTTMVVHPKDIVCQRGETHGRAQSVFHRTGRNIELYPNRMVRFQLVCKTGKATGNLSVTIPRAFPRIGRKMGAETQIAAEWSYYAEDANGNRNISSKGE